MQNDCSFQKAEARSVTTARWSQGMQAYLGMLWAKTSGKYLEYLSKITDLTCQLLALEHIYVVMHIKFYLIFL